MKDQDYYDWFRSSRKVRMPPDIQNLDEEQRVAKIEEAMRSVNRGCVELLFVCACGQEYITYLPGNPPMHCDWKNSGVTCMCGLSLNAAIAVCGHSAGFFNAMMQLNTPLRTGKHELWL